MTEWFQAHKIKHRIVEHDNGITVVSSPLSIDKIIDLTVSINSVISEDTSVSHINKHAQTMIWVGNKSITEDQFKYPTNKLIRKQSSYRSDYGRAKSFGGITGYKGGGSRSRSWGKNK